MSVHELFKKSLSLAATTWQDQLDEATSEAEVVMVARDFMANVEHWELAMVPAACQPGKFFDANDITGYAFTLISNEADVDSESARLVKKLSAFFSAASIRLAQLLASRPLDNRRSA
jgi:hypothetical protein